MVIGDSTQLGFKAAKSRREPVLGLLGTHIRQSGHILRLQLLRFWQSLNLRQAEYRLGAAVESIDHSDVDAKYFANCIRRYDERAKGLSSAESKRPTLMFSRVWWKLQVAILRSRLGRRLRVATIEPTGVPETRLVADRVTQIESLNQQVRQLQLQTPRVLRQPVVLAVAVFCLLAGAMMSPLSVSARVWGRWSFEEVRNRLELAGFSVRHTSSDDGTLYVLADKRGADVLVSLEVKHGIIFTADIKCEMPVGTLGVAKELGASEVAFSDALSAVVSLEFSKSEWRRILDWHFEPIRSQDVGRESESSRTIRRAGFQLTSRWAVVSKWS